jgi:hypothetical protein
VTRSPSVKRYLKERCSNYRAALLEAQLVSEAELAAVWPGSPDNRGHDVAAWLHTFWNIARFFARVEARDEYTAGVSESRTDQLLHLQQGTPRVVRLHQPVTIDGATVDELHLHHKSFTSLRRLATYARVSAQLLMHIAHLEGSPEHVDLVIAAQEWRERILRMLIWGAVSDGPDGTGTGLPWDPAREPWPDVPTWLEALDSTEVLAVQIAYTEQYGRALLSISPFIAPNDDEKDPLAGWETFFASYATEKGLEAHRLMQDRAFLPFLTQVSLAAHSARQAREQAKDTPEPAGVR